MAQTDGAGGHRESWWRIRGALDRRLYLVIAVASFVLFVAGWWALAASGWFDPLFLPAPDAVIERLHRITSYNVCYTKLLRSLTTACNQKSNREPVMDLSESTVLEALESLTRKHLVWERGGAGSRVQKFAHRLTGTLSQTYEFSREERALLAVLMLRQAQTVGELRTRTARMADFAGLEAVEETLLELATRSDGPYVQELPRQPGQREQRFMHLLAGGELSVETPAPAQAEAEATPELEARVAALEA